MTWKLYNMDNEEFYYATKDVICGKASLIYADYIYENLNFCWVDKYWNLLKQNGIFIVQTDEHSVFEMGCYLKTMPGANYINHLIFKNEFGNFRKDRFRSCHDDILIFSKGKDYKFYPERVQVEKVTAKSKGLNPSGRTTKIATSVITDICLTTISKERIKNKNGKNVPWQKPLALLRRVISPWVDEGELIIDPFAGLATSGVVALELGCDYIGVENNNEIFELAENRLENFKMEEKYNQLEF